MKPITEIVQPRIIMCPVCNHPPLMHEPDGLGGAVCHICLFLAREKKAIHGKEAAANFPVCVTKFIFKLTRAVQEQAVRADKNSYPPHTVCASCYLEWIQHYGFLCPDGNDTFLPLLDCDLPYLHN